MITVNNISKTHAPVVRLAPELDPAVRALLSTAGCAVAWSPTMEVWRVTAGRRKYFVRDGLSMASWIATVKAIVAKTGPAL